MKKDDVRTGVISDVKFTRSGVQHTMIDGIWYTTAWDARIFGGPVVDQRVEFTVGPPHRLYPKANFATIVRVLGPVRGKGKLGSLETYVPPTGPMADRLRRGRELMVHGVLHGDFYRRPVAFKKALRDAGVRKPSDRATEATWDRATEALADQIRNASLSQVLAYLDEASYHRLHY